MNIDKAETWALADRLTIVDLIIDETHTCYENDHETKNAWGYGCGHCNACVLRAKGFEKWSAHA